VPELWRKQAPPAIQIIPALFTQLFHLHFDLALKPVRPFHSGLRDIPYQAEHFSFCVALFCAGFGPISNAAADAVVADRISAQGRSGVLRRLTASAKNATKSAFCCSVRLKLKRWS